jgi:hypothetical protein
MVPLLSAERKDPALRVRGITTIDCASDPLSWAAGMFFRTCQPGIKGAWWKPGLRARDGEG